MIPDAMIAIAIEGGKGPAEALFAQTIATPQPAPGQILVKVAAAGVNRPDVLQRRGGYPPPPGAPETMGLEIAGEVVAVGPEGPGGPCRWAVGDKVTALLPGGGYAQYAVVDSRHALPIPKGLDMIQAAALPETVFTVFSNIFEIGGLKAGETFLVHGANSGIGVMAIAQAKAAGAKVIATGRSAAKLEKARALGADVLIDTTTTDFAAAAKEAGGVDVILDMIGGDYAQKNLDCLKPFGRLVTIAVQSGLRGEVNFGDIMRKRLVVTGSTLRPRANDEKARLAAAVEATVWPWIEAGIVAPVIDITFPLDQAAKAHAHMEGEHVGKIVLTV
jgi:NADPH2:quinone reductase